MYVVDINSKTNEVIVGEKKHLTINKIYLKNLNILGDLKSNKENLFIKVRSTGRLIKAEVKFDNANAEVFLKESEDGISPGQACVFYSKNKLGDKVLGGGWISRTERNYLST